MKLHQQFDLNISNLKPLGRELLMMPPYIIEELANNLSKKGYTVLKSSAYYMGIPQSITVVKEFTGPFISKFANKIREDFNETTKTLGIRELFE